MKTVVVVIGFIALGILAGAEQGCRPVSSFELNIDEPVLGFIVNFSVPDTTYHNNIPVHLSGIIGGSSAFHFDRINVIKTDTLIEMGVWGRQVQLNGVNYTPGDVTFDTTMIFQTTHLGTLFIEVIAANGIFVDTTTVY